MSVAENMAYGLKLRKMPKDEINQRVNQAAGMLELTPYLERKPAQLSGGQRQRVAMGRAIVRQPQVFLMDEPLSNLDAKLRVQMRAEISALVHSLGTTTVYVTHDQTEAMTMGDRMAVMKAGILQQLGTPGECYDNPNNIFVAQFVGSPPMNLVMADVIDAGEGHMVLRVGRVPLSVTPGLLEAKPALRNYAGRRVVLGVRSEDMEDASLREVPGDQRLQGAVTLTEALGSEVVVHFSFDGERVETADTKLIAKETGEEELQLAGEGVKWVASFAPRSRVRAGDTIEIAVDVDRVHLFDPETSEAIRA
jgi:multiple sugar transport system ATP-binding protein